MKFTNNIKILLLIFTLTACQHKNATVSEGGFYHHNIYFGKDVHIHTQRGIKDGCATAEGLYTKSHWFFKEKKEYLKGWFIGRNKCRK